MGVTMAGAFFVGNVFFVVVNTELACRWWHSDWFLARANLAVALINLVGVGMHAFAT